LEGEKERLALAFFKEVSDQGEQGVHLGLFGPYTKNTMLRSIPPGLKRLGTNLVMLVKEVEGAWDKP